MPTCRVDDVNAVVCPHEADPGKHSDTVAGEVRTLRALVDREDDTMAMLVSEAGSWRRLEGVLAGGPQGSIQRPWLTPSRALTRPPALQSPRLRWRPRRPAAVVEPVPGVPPLEG